MGAVRVGVVGLGAAGMFAALALARRGAQVTGFEQFSIGHDRGASAGETRLFRVLYGEGSIYTDLLLRARELFLELGQQAGTSLLDTYGALTIGDRSVGWLASMIDSAEKRGLPCSVLDRRDMARKYPQYGAIGETDVAILDPMGGIVRSNESIARAAMAAKALGARLHDWTTVTSVEEDGAKAVISTAEGEQRFDHVIVATGPWAKKLLPSARLTVRPVLQTHHVSLDSTHAGASFPPAMVMRGNVMIYGVQPMPDSHIVKYFSDGLADYRGDDDEVAANFAASRHDVSDDYFRKVAAEIPGRFPGLRPEASRGYTYYEGYTPDKAPLIDRQHPTSRIIHMVGLSGHGFKLAPAYGEIAANIALDTTPPVARAFALSRFDHAA